MLISKAHAAMADVSDEMLDLAGAPTPMESFIWNIGMVIVLVGLFYVLLIMPQQRRFKEHSDMLSDLKKGDKVITGGGLVGKIDKVIDDKEVLLDLGNGTKVTALRSMIQSKTVSKAKLVTNDSKGDKPKSKAKAKSKAEDKKDETSKTAKKDAPKSTKKATKKDT